MKKTLLFLLLPFCHLLTAQTYEPLQVASGFNADVIANGLGTAVSSTTVGLDNANFCLMAANFQVTAANTPPSYALPVTGLIPTTTPNFNYQMADYSGNNSLRLVNQNNTGTLVFSNQVAATNLYFLLNSGSGPATVSGIITFTDNTTQAIAASVIPDWFFSNALPVVISGIGRVGRLDNLIENPAGDPRLYQLAIAINAANQDKPIASVQLTKTSVAEGVANIYAVTAKLAALGVEEQQAQKFVVYPNPVRDALAISGTSTIAQARVFNVLGQEIVAQNGIGDTQLVLDASQWPTGNYIVKVTTDTGTQSIHVIKE